jgi:hypothetical protein
MPVWLKLWVFEKLLFMFGIDNCNFLYFFNIISTCPSLFFNSLGLVNNFTALDSFIGREELISLFFTYLLQPLFHCYQ